MMDPVSSSDTIPSDKSPISSDGHSVINFEIRSHEETNRQQSRTQSTNSITNQFFSRCSSFSCAERLLNGNFLVIKIPFRLNLTDEVVLIPVYAHPFWLYFWIMETAIGFHISVDHAITTSIVLGPVLLLSIIIHEYGHIAMIKYRGGSPPEKAVIWPFGGVAWCTNDASLSPWNTVLIAIAGPLTHIPQALIWLLLFLMVRLVQNYHFNGHLGTLVCERAIGLQVYLIIINLLPAFPLDGSLLLFCTLRSCCKWDRQTAMKVTAAIGAVC